jgi:hypothetical protein
MSWMCELELKIQARGTSWSLENVNASWSWSLELELEAQATSCEGDELLSFRRSKDKRPGRSSRPAGRL